MSETTAAPPLAWSRAFAATPAQAGQARRFLAGLLDGYLLADDAILCLSEMAANAILHSNSRKQGGHFTVRAEIQGERLRFEVHDEGGPWTVPPPDDVQRGHGLHIISQLAHAWGITGDSDTGWTVWAEITCFQAPTETRIAAPGTAELATRIRHAELAARSHIPPPPASQPQGNRHA